MNKCLLKDVLLDDVIDALKTDDTFYEKATLSFYLKETSPIWKAYSASQASSSSAGAASEGKTPVADDVVMKSSSN